MLRLACDWLISQRTLSLLEFRVSRDCVTLSATEFRFVNQFLRFYSFFNRTHTHAPTLVFHVTLPSKLPLNSGKFCMFTLSVICAPVLMCASRLDTAYGYTFVLHTFSDRGIANYDDFRSPSVRIRLQRTSHWSRATSRGLNKHLRSLGPDYQQQMLRAMETSRVIVTCFQSFWITVQIYKHTFFVERCGFWK